MRRICIILVYLAFSLQCVGQAPGAQYEGSLHVPSYTGGYILDWDSPTYTQITVYGRDAKAVYSQSLRGEEGRFYSVWAVDSDGTAARAYTWIEGGRASGGVDLLDMTGKATLTIKTGRYLPQHLAFAPDHTLWTVGYEDDYERRAEDFNVIRHYARTGQAIGQALPWLQIAGDFNAHASLQLCLGGKQLYVANGRVGFWAYLHHGQETWIETDPAGNLLGKYDLGLYSELCFLPRTMTASGEVYAKVLKEHRFDGWAVLDRSQRAWRRIEGYPRGGIIGADGNNIIFSQHDGGWTILHSVDSASLQRQPIQQEIPVEAASD